MSVRFPSIAVIEHRLHYVGMRVLRGVLIGLGVLLGVFALGLVPQLSHARYYGDSSETLEILGVGVCLIVASTLCFWGAGRLKKRR